MRAEGKWHCALPLSWEAHRADLNNGAAAHNLAVLLTKLGQLKEGEAVHRHSLAIAPQSTLAVHALAHNLLSQGRYEDGWHLYEVRALMPELNTGFPTDFPFPRWKGESLAGKRLAIFPEQGFGDQIQFVRFLPRLLAEAQSVTMLLLPHLERLFRHNFPGPDYVIASGSVDFPDPDYWTTLHDLPAALKLRLEDIDGKPYLRAPDSWPPLGEGFKVGLKTNGNPRHLNDAYRSLTEADAATLRARLPGTIISLEPQDSGAGDLADTAAIIEQLDLVVSVDTSVAHLAGALGKPCLLLIPGFSPDWRWMQGRTDSPWYDGHRLYRSEIEGGWGSAIDRLVEDAWVMERKAAAKALIDRSEALGYGGQPVEALQAAREAVAADPTSGSAMHSLGILLSLSGQLLESEDALRRVVSAGPELAEARHALGVNLLAQGRYREGWPLYDARIEIEGLIDGFPRTFPFPRWNGEDVRGKHVVLFPEQGIGDQIQFARFVPTLIQRGATVTLLTPPPLKRLFALAFPDVKVLLASGSVDFDDPDFWLTLADLPGRLNLSLGEIVGTPYLTAPPDAAGPGTDFRVGVMVQGNSLYRYDRYRSLAPELVTLLESNLPGTVINLAPHRTGARDFADTAAIIKGLDLVVSVDTAVAHLAGAMGKRCMLLLPGFASDWRWMRGRDMSPWYPRHRLYRGDIAGSRDDAVGRLLEDAHRLADAKALVRGKNVAALLDMGDRLTRDGWLEEGEPLLRRASTLARTKSTHALGVNLLTQGRYDEGYRLAASLPDPVGLPSPPCSRWHGEDVAGKRLLVLPESTLCDAILMARFLPELGRLAANTTLLIPPALARLFQHNFADVAQLPAGKSPEYPPADFWLTAADIADRFGAAAPASSGPYLSAPEVWEGAPPGVKVGLATADPWADAREALPPALAARLKAELPGAVVILAAADTPERDLADIAAMIAAMDVVVAVNGPIAHLAGATGKPCLLLVAEAGDWRWLTVRDASPFYAQHKLFRAGHDGWEAAVDRLIGHLRAIVPPTRALARRASDLRDLGRLDEALSAWRDATERDPNNATALHNLGRLLTDLDRLAEGEAVQRQALEVQPGSAAVQFGLSLNLLAQGRYREAWPLYEARTRLAELNIGFPQNVAFPRWRGEDIRHRRIAVFPEQGLGDQIQFARFLPWLRGRCAGVVLFAPPALVDLFARAFPAVDVVEAAGAASFPQCAVWTTLVDLAALAEATPEALPPGDYLRAASQVSSGTAPRIGVMTKGSPTFVHDALRTLPVEAAAALRGGLPGLLIELDPAISGAKDFSATADIVSGLDLVVSVDTSVAHLAGALGKPCQVLIPGLGPDWRWMHDRDHSPWYPHHRLYRGAIDGDWSDAIGRLIADAHRIALGGAAA